MASVSSRKTAKTKKHPIGKAPGTRRNAFPKGNKLGGRPKGSGNKISRDLKEGIIDAAVAVGSDGKGKEGLLGYLKMLARKHPKQYTGLLSRVMPLQITGDIGGFIGQVNVVSVPVDRYLSADDMKRLNPPNPDEIIEDAEYVEVSKDKDVA